MQILYTKMRTALSCHMYGVGWHFSPTSYDYLNKFMTLSNVICHCYWRFECWLGKMPVARESPLSTFLKLRVSNDEFGIYIQNNKFYRNKYARIQTVLQKSIISFYYIHILFNEMQLFPCNWASSALRMA